MINTSKMVFKWFNYKDKNKISTHINNIWLHELILQTYIPENTINDKVTLLYITGKYEEALDVSHRNITLDQEHIMSLYYMGLCYYGIGKYLEALKCLTKVEGKTNFNNFTNYFINECRKELKDGLQSYFTEADEHDTLNHHDLALAVYDDIILIDPFNHDAYNDKGCVFKKAGNFIDAIRCYDKALEINPAYCRAYNNRGNALRELKRYEEAIECFDKSLAIDGSNDIALEGKGNVLKEIKLYDQALNCFDRVIEIDEYSITAYESKGMIMLELGQYQQAIGYFDKCIEIDYAHFSAYANKAEALKRLMRYEEAVECYLYILTLCPDSPRGIVA
jgi:tetratricopeptide (TPR) repeat protein